MKTALARVKRIVITVKIITANRTIEMVPIAVPIIALSIQIRRSSMALMMATRISWLINHWSCTFMSTSLMMALASRLEAGRYHHTTTMDWRWWWWRLNINWPNYHTWWCRNCYWNWNHHWDSYSYYFWTWSGTRWSNCWGFNCRRGCWWWSWCWTWCWPGWPWICHTSAAPTTHFYINIIHIVVIYSDWYVNFICIRYCIGQVYWCVDVYWRIWTAWSMGRDRWIRWWSLSWIISSCRRTWGWCGTCCTIWLTFRNFWRTTTTLARSLARIRSWITKTVATRKCYSQITK